MDAKVLPKASSSQHVCVYMCVYVCVVHVCGACVHGACVCGAYVHGACVHVCVVHVCCHVDSISSLILWLLCHKGAIKSGKKYW